MDNKDDKEPVSAGGSLLNSFLGARYLLMDTFDKVTYDIAA